MSLSYFEFPVLTDEEIESLGFLEEGIYEFVIEKAEPGISKAGNKKIDLTLKVIDRGNHRFVFDCLVATENMAYKIKHLCESVGLSAAYEAGKLCPDVLIGRNGMLELYHQKGNVKPDGTKYKDKMAVRDYLSEKGDARHKSPVNKPIDNNQPVLNDDIPF